MSFSKIRETMKQAEGFVIPTELLAAFMAGYLGWVGWISISVSNNNARIAVLEDRDGIHAEAKVATTRSPTYASFYLVKVPEFFKGKK